MKQITIFCATDLEDLVVSAFDRVGIRSFSAIMGASGNLFAPQGEVPRMETFDAMVIMVPATDEDKARSLMDLLEKAAEGGGTETCLRAVVSPAERAVGHD
jgi:hypothetical protein